MHYIYTQYKKYKMILIVFTLPTRQVRISTSYMNSQPMTLYHYQPKHRYDLKEKGKS